MRSLTLAFVCALLLSLYGCLSPMSLTAEAPEAPRIVTENLAEDLAKKVEPEPCIKGTPCDLELIQSTRILFKRNSAKLSPAQKRKLDLLAAVLHQHPEAGGLIIHGHTDQFGPQSYNMRLSEKRAKAVEKYLMKAGVKAAKLKVQSYGKSKLLDQGLSKSAHASNRRVDFSLSS